MVASATAIDSFTPELTIREASNALGVSQKTVRRYLTEGSLIARNAAPLSSARAMWRIPLDAIQAMRSSYTVQGKLPRAAAPSSPRVLPYTPKHIKPR